MYILQRPLILLASGDMTQISRHRLLLMWYFEHEVKSKYTQYVDKIKVGFGWRGGGGRGTGGKVGMAGYVSL